MIGIESIDVKVTYIGGVYIGGIIKYLEILLQLSQILEIRLFSIDTSDRPGIGFYIYVELYIHIEVYI